MRGLRLSNLQRIAVFRALNLGDMLCAMPSFRAIRHALPNADIRLIGLPHMAPLARRFSRYISSFSSFPGAPGLPEQPFTLEPFLAFLEEEAQAQHDLVIQMHGKGSVTNSIVCMFAGGEVSGYFESGAFCPDDQLFMPYPDGLPEVERHLRLIEFLGFQRQGEFLEFPLYPDDWSALMSLQQTFSFVGQPYVCLHPGARDIKRWWAPKKFAQVADELARKGYAIIFTGSDGEKEAINHIRSLMRRPASATSLAGKTSLGTLAALIAKSRLLVSNDTGVSHIAAATLTPSVVVFLASDPTRWAPLNRDIHRIVESSEDDVEGVLNEAEHALANIQDRRSNKHHETRR